MSSGNGAVLDKAKPAATKLKKGVQSNLRKISYDANPRRTKMIFGTKVAIPAIIVGMLINRRRRQT